MYYFNNEFIQEENTEYHIPDTFIKSEYPPLKNTISFNEDVKENNWNFSIPEDDKWL